MFNGANLKAFLGQRGAFASALIMSLVGSGPRVPFHRRDDGWTGVGKNWVSKTCCIVSSLKG